MENKCLVCGAIIPEGRQVCPTCKKGGKHEISKKLTDEEVVKALYCIKGQYISYIDDDDDKCRLLFVDDILALINRQKASIEQQNKEYIELDLELRELRTELDKELTEHEEFTLKAKSEIERLTEELDLANETIDRNNKRYERVSIERQKALDRVDYLEDALLDKIRRNEELITAIKQAEQQAVKDTAKEICEFILKYWQGHDLVECDWLRVAIAEKYGVEVE